MTYIKIDKTQHKAIALGYNRQLLSRIVNGYSGRNNPNAR